MHNYTANAPPTSPNPNTMQMPMESMGGPFNVEHHYSSNPPAPPPLMTPASTGCPITDYTRMLSQEMQSLTSTQRNQLRVQKIPLDTTIVQDPNDKKIVDRINFCLINIDDTVPCFTEKTIDNMGFQYKITFVWGDELFHLSAKVVNEKLLSIPGVLDVHYGNKRITVFLRKSGAENEDHNNLDYSTLRFGASSNDVEPSIVKTIDGKYVTKYVPKDEAESNVHEMVNFYHSNLSEITKGFLMKYMKESIVNIDETKLSQELKKRKKNNNKLRRRTTEQRDEKRKRTRKDHNRSSISSIFSSLSRSKVNKAK